MGKFVILLHCSRNLYRGLHLLLCPFCYASDEITATSPWEVSSVFKCRMKSSANLPLLFLLRHTLVNNVNVFLVEV